MGDLTRLGRHEDGFTCVISCRKPFPILGRQRKFHGSVKRERKGLVFASGDLPAYHSEIQMGYLYDAQGGKGKGRNETKNSNQLAQLH